MPPQCVNAMPELMPEVSPAGRSKEPSSKAAASEDRRRYPPHFVGPFARTMDPGERINPSSTSASENLNRYVEGLNDAGTTLAASFNVLLLHA